MIPGRGLGTRFLPATKAMPKEMLPVVDKPAIQYVVEEAVAAGPTDVLMVTGRNKARAGGPLRPQLPSSSAALEAKGDAARLERVRALDRAGRRSTTSARATRSGLGHAVLCAAEHVGRRAVRGAARRRPDRPARPVAARR